MCAENWNDDDVCMGGCARVHTPTHTHFKYEVILLLTVGERKSLMIKALLPVLWLSKGNS